MSLLSKLGLGLKNAYVNILDKLSSLKGTPENIAKGFATGAAMSFTPFVGFHLLLSFIVAKLTKQNGVAAALGTIVGNPWTFPFIWYLTLHTGHFMLSREAPQLPVDFKALFSELYHAVIKLDFNAFINDIWPIYYPMLIGCIPYYIGVWYLCSYLIKQVLAKNLHNGD